MSLYLSSNGFTVGFQQLAAISTATKLTVPNGANFAVVTVEGEPVRYRSDGTAPTASVGVLVPVTTDWPLPILGRSVLGAIQFIPTTGSATLNVEYYQQ